MPSDGLDDYEPSDPAEAHNERIIVTCGLYFSLWARLIEVGIRATFCTLSLVCACLYENLGNQIDEVITEEELKDRVCLNEELADQTEEFKINKELNTSKVALGQWKNDYENIHSLVENLSSLFGLVLLFLLGNDFFLSMFRFEEMLQRPNKVEQACAFFHQLFRVLVLLSASNRVQNKVTILLFDIFKNI